MEHANGRGYAKSITQSSRKNTQASPSDYDAREDAAKKAVVAQLRAQGLKAQNYSCRDIALLAEDYLAQHRAPGAAPIAGQEPLRVRH
jgi:hypothetical protein